MSVKELLIRQTKRRLSAWQPKLDKKTFITVGIVLIGLWMVWILIQGLLWLIIAILGVGVVIWLYRTFIG
jgi:Flp pilus assembly protein TadB